MYPNLMLALLDVYMRNPPVLLCSISMPMNCKLDDWAPASHPQTANNLVGKFILKYLSQLLPPSTNPHCLYTKNDKGYGGIGCINLTCTRVKAARVVVIASITDNAA